MKRTRFAGSAAAPPPGDLITIHKSRPVNLAIGARDPCSGAIMVRQQTPQMRALLREFKTPPEIAKLRSANPSLARCTKYGSLYGRLPGWHLEVGETPIRSAHGPPPKNQQLRISRTEPVVIIESDTHRTQADPEEGGARVPDTSRLSAPAGAPAGIFPPEGKRRRVSSEELEEITRGVLHWKQANDEADDASESQASAEARSEDARKVEVHGQLMSKTVPAATRLPWFQRTSTDYAQWQSRRQATARLLLS